MTYPFNKTVNILGTVYTIEVVDKTHDQFKRHPDTSGCTSWADRKILLLDRVGEPPKDADQEDLQMMIIMMKKTLRHEIAHAFLSESGLFANTFSSNHWANNEEMVDWIAMQGPKMMAAWTEAGAL